MDIRNDFKPINKSEYMTDVHVVLFSKSRLTKRHIKKHNRDIIGVIVTALSGLFFTCCGVGFLSNMLEAPFALTIFIWIFGIAFLILGLCCLISVPFAIREKARNRKQIDSNNLILVRAEMTHIYEDVSTAEGPDLIGDSYVTYICKSNENKKIKIVKKGTSEKYFTENPTAFFAFTINNDELDEKPILLYIGKTFDVADDIRILS